MYPEYPKREPVVPSSKAVGIQLVPTAEELEHLEQRRKDFEKKSYIDKLRNEKIRLSSQLDEIKYKLRELGDDV